MAEMSFDVENPPKRLTNPDGLPVGEYPALVYKWSDEPEAKWGTVFNITKRVENEAEKVAAVAEGWSLTYVKDAPKSGKK